MILVVGSMNLDRIARVERVPGPGETVPLQAVDLAAGGKGGNAAAAAARMGARVAMLARVGEDADGAFLKAALATAGVDVAAVAETREAPTGTALIWVEASGENRIGVLAGANATLTPAAVDAQSAPGRLFETSRLVLLNLEIPLATVRHAVDRAHAAGCRVLLNLSPVADLPLDRLGAADAVVVNGPEAAALLGGAPPADLEAALDAARRLVRAGPGTAVVTLGAAGAAAAAAGTEIARPAVPVQAVDTTGAGDAFLGALAAGLDRGLDLESAVAVAMAAAAFTVTRPGAQAAQPTRSQLWAWARRRRLGLPPWPARGDGPAPAGRGGAPRPRAG